MLQVFNKLSDLSGVAMATLACEKAYKHGRWYFYIKSDMFLSG